MRRVYTSIALVILLLVIVGLAIQFRVGTSQPERLSIDGLVDELKQENVIRLIVDETEVEVIFTDGSMALTRKEGGRSLVQQLQDLGVSEEMFSSDHIQIEVKEPSFMIQSNLVPLAVAGGVGIILGAALMLLAIRAGYINA